MFAVSIIANMPEKFVLNDQSVVNSHGFIIQNAGGIFDRFNENPVMLDAHDGDSCLNVIGRWGALAVEGNRLVSTPEFDMEDDSAAKISGKVDRGFVKGVSMGIYILDAEMNDLPGIGFIPVVTKWELLEASPVPVPSNKASLRLYANDRKTILKDEQISLSIDSIINQKTVMEKVTLSVEAAKVLGLGKEPEATELNAAIMELSAKLSTANQAKEKAETELKNRNLARATSLVKEGLAAGKFTADKEASMMKLAVADFDQAKDIIDAMPGKRTFSEKVVPLSQSGGSVDREGWDYMRWLKEDPAGLIKMQADDPEGFTTLKASFKSKYSE